MAEAERIPFSSVTVNGTVITCSAEEDFVYVSIASSVEPAQAQERQQQPARGARTRQRWYSRRKDSNSSSASTASDAAEVRECVGGVVIALHERLCVCVDCDCMHH